MSFPDPIRRQTTLALDATGQSAWLETDKFRNSVHIKWPATGSPVGTFSIETAADVGDTKDAVALAASEVTPSGATQPNETASSTVLNFSTAEPFVRVKYTRTSGGAGATATITLSGKL